MVDLKDYLSATRFKGHFTRENSPSRHHWTARNQSFK